MNILDASIVPEHARAVKQEAREFAIEHIEPAAETYYESGKYPWEVLEAGMSANLVAQDIAEEYGGRGFDLPQTLAIYEELYRADASIALTLQLASFGTDIVYKHGTAEQNERYVRPVAENEQITGLAVSEPDSGSDLAGMTTTAEKDGDEWIVNGEKYWVGNAVEADWLTLYAKTGDGDTRYDDYSLFILPTDASGYTVEHIPEKMAYRASKQGHITLNQCRIPDSHLIGDVGDGFEIVTEFFNHGRVDVAGHGLGLAAAAIEEASQFVHNREAWDQQVSDFQAVKHDLAEMRMELESARALTWRAAKHVTENNNPGYWAALAKTTATEAAVNCAESAMQLYGGRSVLKENKISRIYRDVRVPVIYEGANNIQRDLIYKQADWS